MSLRARLTLFFVAIVVVPLLVAGFLVRSAIAREVQGRTDIRLHDEVRTVAVARLELTATIEPRVRDAAAHVARELGTGSGQDRLEAALEDARRSSRLDFVVLAPPPGSEPGQIVGAVEPGRFLDPRIRFTPETIADPRGRQGLLIRSAVPVTAGGDLRGTVYAGLFLDQDQAAALSRLSGGVELEIPVEGRIAVSTLSPPAPLPRAGVGVFSLPGERRGMFLRIPGAPASASIAVVAPLEGAVGYLRNAILIVLFGSMALATLLGYGLARIVSAPIRRLADEAMAVLSEAPDEPQRERPADEVAALATTLTTMTEHLQEAERLSMTDALTGIGNRRFLEITLRKEVERARRYERGLSVLMIDVDRFKAVNDRYGHDRGDRVLAAIAHRVEGAIRREIDTVVRFGGEEFVVLLPETGPQGAVSVAERIRRAVESEPFGILFGESIPVTVSLGVASYPDHGRNAQEVIRAADLAMYGAKRRGRNHVEMSKSRRHGPTRAPASTSTGGRPGIDS